MFKFKKCIFCNCSKFERKFEYKKPIKVEIKLNLKKQKYKRFYKCCANCGHWFTEMGIDLSKLYDGNYMDATYENKIYENFKKIIKLPKKNSDNYYRVKRIMNFSNNFFINKKINLLDIGSGLGVFPYEVKKLGWKCTSIEPDKKASIHLKKNLKIDAVHADYLKLKFRKKFNVITLNKVLEHVRNPILMLSKIKKNLIKNNNFFYIEVPDATEASKEGKYREEFTIDHLHVFSMQSLMLLIKKSKFQNFKIQRIRENSGKFTLIAFGKY